MARVLGVHGIGQQYQSGPELTGGWWKALRGGLDALVRQAVLSPAAAPEAYAAIQKVRAG